MAQLRNTGDDAYKNAKALNDELTALKKACPWLSAIQLNDVRLIQDEPIEVGHQLGKRWRGFAIVEKPGYGDIKSTRTSRDERIIKLTSNTTLTVSLLIW